MKTTNFPPNPATALLIGDRLYDWALSRPKPCIIATGIVTMLEKKQLGLLIRDLQEQLTCAGSSYIAGRELFGDDLADLIVNYG